MSLTNYPEEQNELKKRLDEFLEALPTKIEDMRDNYSRIALFIYFLTIKEGEGIALKSSILQLFDLSDIIRPSNIDRDLGAMVENKRILTTNEGFRLHRKELAKVESEIKSRQKTIQLKHELEELVQRIKNKNEKNFLEEAIRCFGTKPPSKRASIIMTWIVCIDHLQNHVLNSKKKLKDFNNALSKSNQKIKKIYRKNIFSELDESLFIVKLRESKIVDKNVGKLLEEMLNFRNSCAHPNDMHIPESKVEAFIEDAINNIILRFRVR